MKNKSNSKLLIHAGFFAVAVIILYLALVFPAQRNLSRARADAVAAASDRAKAEQKLTMLTNEINVMSPVPLDALTSEEMPIFLRDLSVRCRTTGSSVDRIRQIMNRDKSNNAIGVVYPQKFEIGLEGDFPSLYRMLVELEDYHKLMTIDALRFEVGSRGEHMKAVAQATVYILDLGRRSLSRPGPVRSVP
jgi:hypothetical protein